MSGRIQTSLRSIESGNLLNTKTALKNQTTEQQLTSDDDASWILCGAMPSFPWDCGVKARRDSCPPIAARSREDATQYLSRQAHLAASSRTNTRYSSKFGRLPVRLFYYSTEKSRPLAQEDERRIERKEETLPLQWKRLITVHLQRARYIRWPEDGNAIAVLRVKGFQWRGMISTRRLMRRRWYAQ